jgi:virginiamycin B lyase
MRPEDPGLTALQRHPADRCSTHRWRALMSERSGNLTRYNPQTRRWTTWPLPGDDPAAYGVFVDDADIVWVSDFGGNALMRFDPADESFIVYPLPHDPGDVRQILGRPGEVWAPESAADQLVLIRTR